MELKLKVPAELKMVWSQRNIKLLGPVELKLKVTVELKLMVPAKGTKNE